tara:strand:- start:713 stop:841 length:129 start_codon:yes stop_codon:yes gene_type:complete
MKSKILLLIAKIIVSMSFKTAEDFERLLGYLIEDKYRQEGRE